MSDNFFLYNRQFPSYKPLKSVTVGSGRAGPGRAGPGRVGPVHSIYRLIGSKQTLFVPSTICPKCFVSEIQLFLMYPLVRYSLLRALADAHFASLAINTFLNVGTILHYFGVTDLKSPNIKILNLGPVRFHVSANTNNIGQLQNFLCT